MTCGEKLLTFFYKGMVSSDDNTNTITYPYNGKSKDTNCNNSKSHDNYSKNDIKNKYV